MCELCDALVRNLEAPKCRHCKHSLVVEIEDGVHDPECPICWDCWHASVSEIVIGFFRAWLGVPIEAW